MTAPALLVARVGSERYGLDVGAVRGVMDVADVTPVPGGAPGLLGVLRRGPHFVPLFSLEAVLDGAGARPAGCAVVLTLGDADLALGVDEVETVTAPGAAFLAGSGAPAGDRLVRGVCRCGEALVTVLDPGALAARLTAERESDP